jgi:regulator of chromosome condensation
VNDGGALGRVTDKVPDPANPGQTLDRDVLEATPAYIQSLVDEGFEAVRVVAGDSVSMAISAEGKVKYWGSFRVSTDV